MQYRLADGSGELGHCAMQVGLELHADENDLGQS
jgi:hypothetical protein